MTTVEQAKMTIDEVALLRELVKWRRNHGADYDFQGATLRLADGRTIAWNTTSALHWPRAGEVGVRDCRLRPLVWHEAETVTQAVDVLVALGYLPARFSSAYRAGWENAMIWEKCDGNDVIFRLRFHDSENISFPAVEPAW